MSLKGSVSANVAASAMHAGRKTLPLQMANLLAKEDVTAQHVKSGSLDAALASLSVEQRDCGEERDDAIWFIGLVEKQIFCRSTRDKREINRCGFSASHKEFEGVAVKAAPFH